MADHEPHVPAGVTVLTVNGHTPQIDPTAFVAPGAVIAGNVSIAAGASIWFGCVLRAETVAITIGRDSNVQDNSVVHADPDFPVAVGDRVTVGHRVVLHGCTVHDDALVGMGSVVLNGASVGAGSLVGAGAVVTEGTVVAADAVVLGAPARPETSRHPRCRVRTSPPTSDWAGCIATPRTGDGIRQRVSSPGCVTGLRQQDAARLG